MHRNYDRALEFYLSEPRIDWNIVQKIYRATNEHERLQSLADSLRVAFEEDLDEAIQKQAGPTGIAWLHANIARQHAILGEREAATRQVETALEKYRKSVDAVNYGGLLNNVAAVYMWLGDHDRAIDLLKEKLAHENGSTAAWLRLDPFYDPLRDRPRFQALLERYE